MKDDGIYQLLIINKQFLILSRTECFVVFFIFDQKIWSFSQYWLYFVL